MERAVLGRTGLEVSRLGAGLVQIGRKDVGNAGRLLNEALDGGVTFLDRAECHGPSEEFIGRTIAHRRPEYVLATKVGHAVDRNSRSVGIDPDGNRSWSASTMRASIDRSLRRLKTDRVDLLQAHAFDTRWPPWTTARSRSSWTRSRPARRGSSATARRGTTPSSRFEAASSTPCRSLSASSISAPGSDSWHWRGTRASASSRSGPSPTRPGVRPPGGRRRFRPADQRSADRGAAPGGRGPDPRSTGRPRGARPGFRPGPSRGRDRHRRHRRPGPHASQHLDRREPATHSLRGGRGALPALRRSRLDLGGPGRGLVNPNPPLRRPPGACHPRCRARSLPPPNTSG